MIIPIINTDKTEITVGVTVHITSWYFKCALPIAIDCDWGYGDKNNKCYAVRVDILCFTFFVEIWRWKK